MIKIKHLQKETIEFLLDEYLELARLKKLEDNEIFIKERAINFFHSNIIERRVSLICEIFPYLYSTLGIESRIIQFENIVLEDANFVNYRAEEFEEEYKDFELHNVTTLYKKLNQ